MKSRRRFASPESAHCF